MRCPAGAAAVATASEAAVSAAASGCSAVSRRAAREVLYMRLHRSQSALSSLSSASVVAASRTSPSTELEEETIEMNPQSSHTNFPRQGFVEEAEIICVEVEDECDMNSEAASASAGLMEGRAENIPVGGGLGEFLEMRLPPLENEAKEEVEDEEESSFEYSIRDDDLKVRMNFGQTRNL